MRQRCLPHPDSDPTGPPSLSHARLLPIVELPRADMLTRQDPCRSPGRTDSYRHPSKVKAHKSAHSSTLPGSIDGERNIGGCSRSKGDAHSGCVLMSRKCKCFYGGAFPHFLCSGQPVPKREFGGRSVRYIKVSGDFLPKLVDGESEMLSVCEL